LYTDTKISEILICVFATSTECDINKMRFRTFGGMWYQQCSI